ncbi:MAG: histidine phosphatase family protein [Gemmatimonadetes bacterium]|nr:histidine phosphatase family protein [Gemmatimonadota bacterium]
MTTRRISPGHVLVWIALLTLLASGPALAQATDVDGGSIVWLVRHAERADAGADDQPDPELSDVGRVRAAELARFLGEAGLTSIYSTSYQRTMQTADPLAQALGLTVESYDPRSMGSLIEILRRPGRHLVVGHSNTTPALVEQLGGDPGSSIEVEEYDRIYVLHIGRDGDVQTTVLRFGRPAPGE